MYVHILFIYSRCTNELFSSKLQENTKGLFNIESWGYSSITFPPPPLSPKEKKNL